jgi:hypothetical protein
MRHQQLFKQLIDGILNGDGESTKQQRISAFENTDLPQPLAALINKVAYRAYRITDSDINTIKATGFNEDQLFELIICAAVGQASRQYQKGLAALTEAMKKRGFYAS